MYKKKKNNKSVILRRPAGTDMEAMSSAAIIAGGLSEKTTETGQYQSSFEVLQYLFIVLLFLIFRWPIKLVGTHLYYGFLSILHRIRTLRAHLCGFHFRFIVNKVYRVGLGHREIY